jgi:hypothetical protein
MLHFGLHPSIAHVYSHHSGHLLFVIASQCVPKQTKRKVNAIHPASFAQHVSLGKRLIDHSPRRRCHLPLISLYHHHRFVNTHSPDSHVRTLENDTQDCKGATSHTKRVQTTSIVVWALGKPLCMFLSCFFQLTKYLHLGSKHVLTTAPKTTHTTPNCCTPPFATAASPCSQGGWQGNDRQETDNGDGEQQTTGRGTGDDERQKTRDEANNASITHPHTRQTTQHPLPALRATARRVDCEC